MWLCTDVMLSWHQYDSRHSEQTHIISCVLNLISIYGVVSIRTYHCSKEVTTVGVVGCHRSRGRCRGEVAKLCLQAKQVWGGRGRDGGSWWLLDRSRNSCTDRCWTAHQTKEVGRGRAWGRYAAWWGGGHWTGRVCLGCSWPVQVFVRVEKLWSQAGNLLVTGAVGLLAGRTTFFATSALALLKLLAVSSPWSNPT